MPSMLHGYNRDRAEPVLAILELLGHGRRVAYEAAGACLQSTSSELPPGRPPEKGQRDRPEGEGKEWKDH